VAQRGTSQSIAHDGTTNAFVADRFKFFTYTMDQLDGTVAQVSDGPSGFPYSLKWTTGTAETTIDASEYASFEYYVEAQDLQRLAYGTSSAQPLTLSFWVKSSVADDFGVSVYKGDGTPRVINLVYTINAADTWEYKTITFAGDTDSSGSIDNDNGTGFIISWGLAVGSTYNGDPNTTWGDYSSAKWLATQDQNTVITTAGATWQITGVQLEVGDTATPFEHRSYGDELARCQRYYNSIHAHYLTYYTSTSCISDVTYPVTMRTSPVVTIGSNNNGSIVAGGASPSGHYFYLTSAANAYYAASTSDAEL
jgi:hypothetical protein